jgi:hypothetical protein
MFSENRTCTGTELIGSVRTECPGLVLRAVNNVIFRRLPAPDPYRRSALAASLVIRHGRLQAASALGCGSSLLSRHQSPCSASLDM